MTGIRAYTNHTLQSKSVANRMQTLGEHHCYFNGNRQGRCPAAHPPHHPRTISVFTVVTVAVSVALTRINLHTPPPTHKSPAHTPKTPPNNHTPWWRQTTKKPNHQPKRNGHPEGQLLGAALHVRTQRIELLREIRVATVDVVDVVHHSFPLGDQASEHQARTGANVGAPHRRRR